MTGIAKYSTLTGDAPLADAVTAAGPGLSWLRPFINIGIIGGLSSVILVLLMGQPRIFFSMARDGLLPMSFARVHPKFKTPYITTILTGIVASVMAGLFPISILGLMVNIGTLFAFLIVCISILFLRYHHPELKPAFRTPWVPFVPILGAVVIVMQMLALPGDTWIRFLVWNIIGLAVYFGYSRHHSRLRTAEQGIVAGRRSDA
jgi:APA family basic amino acid/polyamine antiporter